METKLVACVKCETGTVKVFVYENKAWEIVNLRPLCEACDEIAYQARMVLAKVPSKDAPLGMVEYDNPHGSEWRIISEKEVTCHREQCAVDGGNIKHENFQAGDFYCNLHTFGIVRFQEWECKEGYRASYCADKNDVWTLGAN